MAWTIRWRIVASFGIVLAAMVVMGRGNGIQIIRPILVTADGS
jgi:hypothetical protein